MGCQALPDGAGFISSMSSHLDCQAQLLGSGAWQALAIPGSTLSVLLTSFLTIFIALIGYNLILGHSLSVRSGTLAFVKIGAVLALTTSWPAYRTLVYDLVIDGPGQLVAEVGPKAGIVGSDGTLLKRLDLADRAFAQLAILGPGNYDVTQNAQVPPPFDGFDSFALGGSRILFLLTAVAGLAAVRIVTGLMLALGPFFIAFLMFENTRTLFEGWVRVLAGAALAAVGVSSTLGIELALLEPWLSGINARRMAGEVLPTVSVELFVVSALFAIIVIVALGACIRVASAFRLSPMLNFLPATSNTAILASQERGALTRERSKSADAERSRATAVANALVSMNRNEIRRGNLDHAARPVSTSRAPEMAAGAPGGARISTPVGRSFSRRSTSRVSATANRRDASA